MKKNTVLASISILSVAAVLLSCGRMPSSRHREMVMGTMCEIIVVGGNSTEREEALKVAFEELKEIDRKMSHFDSKSEISRLNEKAFEAPQKVSPETVEIIQRARSYYDKTEGAFDITVFPLMKLWGFYDNELTIPSQDQIAEVLKNVGSDGIFLDQQRGEIQFIRPGMKIDLGAVGKGWACDRAVAVLKERGISSALVNVGGTIFAYGLSPESKKWRVGLRHPRDPSRTFKVISLDNEAVATSGDYENFFVKNGKRYAHILDPRTGYPAKESVAVSVIAPTALLADYLSTALFVLGPEKAPPFSRRYPEVYWYLTYFEEGERFKTLSSSDLP